MTEEQLLRAAAQYIEANESHSDTAVKLVRLREVAFRMREALKWVAESHKLYSEDRGPIGVLVLAAIAKADGVLDPSVPSKENGLEVESLSR